MTDNIQAQLEPELAEMERCLKVMAARINQYHARTPEAKQIKEQCLLAINNHTVGVSILKIAAMALQCEGERHE